MSLLAASAARAAAPPLSVPASPASMDPNNPQTGYAGVLGDLQRSNFLLGDLFGLRSTLARFGISLAIQETSEVAGNATGGTRVGAAYDGLTQAILQLDTQRAFGWYGGLFNISALQLHGRNLSADDLQTLQTASGIEGDRATRLWEAWFDQKFLEEDRLDLRLGQQSVDQEFIYSQNGAVFVGTLFGWPLVPSLDLPGGGPAYPLSNLGVRVRWKPTNAVTLLVGIFDGNPAAKLGGDAQRADPSGTSFPLGGGTLSLVELQVTYPALGALVGPDEGAPLGHTYRIGALYDSQPFADQRFDTTGRSLAAAASNGRPLLHRGDTAIYAVADQMVWRQAADPNRSVSVFARVVATPAADRNLADVSANGGVVLHDPLTNRPDDSLALGFGYAHVSHAASALDRDAVAAAPASYTPVRGAETFVEATYQYQLHPWWQLQPDLQYVFDPGAGVVNAASPTRRVGNEFVLALRTNLLF